jgi:NAD(P)-dependent dehydrogenase (short-subunit alcohol dehydrogenase family)
VIVLGWAIAGVPRRRLENLRFAPQLAAVIPDGQGLADERGAQVIVDTAIDAFGRVDVLINNAGIHDPGLFDTLSVEQFQAMLDVHFFGTVFVSRAAWPHFVKAGYGRIVNTVSEAMLGGIPELTSYGSAKGAVFGLTRNLATEGPAHGIRVNALAPRAYTRRLRRIRRRCPRFSGCRRT